MLFRLLLDAAGGEGGGAGDPPAPDPKPADPPAPISVPADEYTKLLQEREALRAQVAEVERQKAADAEKARQEKLKAIADEKGVQAALDESNKQLQARVAEAEAKANERLNRWLNRERDSLVNGAFAGFDAVSADALADAQAKLAGRVESVVEGEEVVLRFRDSKKPATAEALKALVAGDSFAHYRKASSKGGSGSANADLGAPDEPDPSKMSASDRAIARAKAMGLKPGGGSIGLRK